LYVRDSARSSFYVAVATVSRWTHCGKTIDFDEDLWLIGRGVEHLHWDWFKHQVLSSLLEFASIERCVSSNGMIMRLVRRIFWCVSFNHTLRNFTFETIEVLHGDHDLETVLVRWIASSGHGYADLECHPRNKSLELVINCLSAPENVKFLGSVDNV
jgi:hypothetical protein